MKRTLFYLAATSLLAFNACKKQEEQKEEDKVYPVAVLIAEPQDLKFTVDLPGRIEPFRKAQVRARVSGILQKRVYEEGQDVKEGQLLFEIDPATYEAARDACEASVARAKANLANIQDKERRYRPLAQKGSVSERDHTELVLQEKMAKAELASAEAELTKAKLELDYTRVTSPIAGRARAELVTEGALVGYGMLTPLTTVEQLDPIYAKFTQPASEINDIKRGVAEAGWKGIDPVEIPIHVILPNGKEYKHAGKLVFSDLAVDPETDTVQMKAEFPNPDYDLLPGAYVRVVFDRAVRESVYLIPRVAVSWSGGGAFVMVVGEGNRVEMRKVETDSLSGTDWIVTSGLNKGDKVIVEKTMNLDMETGKKMMKKEPLPLLEVIKVLNDKTEQPN